MEAFDYDLPLSKIAQRPVRPYDSAKMLVINRANQLITESKFSSIEDFLNKDDVLVFNNSKVIPARFFVEFADTKGQAEILLVKELLNNNWVCLARPLKKFTKDRVVLIKDKIKAKVLEQRKEDIVINFDVANKEELFSLGNMPIPPYIRKGNSDVLDKEDYQSIFAKDEGSIAAPTASLHFTPELISQIRNKGINILNLTLHVGTASFLPLFKEGENEIKKPAKETYFIDSNTFHNILNYKQSGKRIVAVGTTVVRALEAIASSKRVDVTEETDLFITKGLNLLML